MALQRSGHSAAMILAVRAPQSKPPRMAFWIFRASMKATISVATAAGWPFRNVSPERNRDVHEAVDVIRPAVKQDDRRPAGGTRFRVSDVQHAGIDLF